MTPPARLLLEFSCRFINILVRPRGLAAWFLLCALPTGLGCALFTPVGMFPDENNHTARADGLRHGEVFGAWPPPGFPPMAIHQGAMVDGGIFGVLMNREFIDSFPTKPVNAADRRAIKAIGWTPGMDYFPSQMAAYFPTFYIPAAAGLAAGQALGMRPLYAYYLGRVLMLLAYLAMGAAAIRLARTGNGLLFAILSLPSTIYLAGSYNQDGVLIGACALAAALLTREEPGRSRSWLAALALLTAVAGSKLPYGVLLLFCVPPLFGAGMVRRVGIVGLACVLPALWFLHTIHNGFIPWPRAAYHPGPLWPGPRGMSFTQVMPADNVKVLLAHPLQIVLLPLTSTAKFWPDTWRLILGAIAYGTTPIAAWEYPCLAAALLLAAAGSALDRPVAGWHGRDGWFAALALFGAFLGMELSQYVTYSQVGLPWIEGVQGRYFLPLLPFLVFLLPWLGRRLTLTPNGLAPNGLSLPAAVMAGVNIVMLPAYLFHIYRMVGP